MGKLTRRGSIIGTAALAGALALSSAALADIDGGNVAIDGDTDVVADPGSPAIWRFADKDRVGTALQAAQRTTINDGAGWGDTVIVANSQVFADALAASPLADALDAPVLLNAPGTNALRGDVAAYIQANFSNVILVGGTDVFGASVASSLTDAGLSVDRVEGANRYQTAIQLAEAAVDEAEYSLENVNVFLASGTDFADALSAGAAATANNGVVLLTKGSEGLDQETFSVLTENGYFGTSESILAIGGPADAAAEAGWNGDPIEPNGSIVGDDRYETAVEVADEYLPEATNFVIASGQNFPDAVVGGAYAANVDGALLLTRESSLTNATGEYLESIRLDVENVFVFGGPDSVAPGVSDQINELDWRY